MRVVRVGGFPCLLEFFPLFTASDEHEKMKPVDVGTSTFSPEMTLN